MFGVYQENFPSIIDSSESLGEYKDYNNSLNKYDYNIFENPFFSGEENILLEEPDEEMNKEKENDIFPIFDCNQGQQEDFQVESVNNQNSKSSLKEYEEKKLYLVTENEQKEDYFEPNLNQNENPNKNQNKEIENKNEEKAFDEKSKEIIENIAENEKEENILVEKEKEILNTEIKAEENIVVNNNKNKIKFKVIKNTNNLFFISFYLFSPLISLINIKSENEKSQREMIRYTIKETKKAFKENKKEIVLYYFNKEIFSISIDKVEAIIKRKDNIRKNVKCAFLKYIKVCLKNKLKRENSEIYFEGFQQSFVINLSKEKNGKSLNMTFEELIKTDFDEEYNKKDKDKKMLNKKRELDKNPNRDKYQKNINAIKYLEENKNISDKINFEKIKKCTYRSLFEEYLESQEFEESVLKLYQKGFEIEYIIGYIINAVKFINFYSESN